MKIALALTPSRFGDEVEHIETLSGFNPDAVLIDAADGKVSLRRIASFDRAAHRPSVLDGIAWRGISVAE